MHFPDLTFCLAIVVADLSYRWALQEGERLEPAPVGRPAPRSARAVAPVRPARARRVFRPAPLSALR